MAKLSSESLTNNLYPDKNGMKKIKIGLSHMKEYFCSRESKINFNRHPNGHSFNHRICHVRGPYSNIQLFH